MGAKPIATGYANEVKWAIFRRESRTFKDVDLGTAPERHIATDRQMEFEYTPFLQPLGDAERSHCEKLAAWWDEVQQRRNEKMGGGVIHHIGNDSTASLPAGSALTPTRKRRHQLVKEVDHNLQPFFDCTVEVRILLAAQMHTSHRYSRFGI